MNNKDKKNLKKTNPQIEFPLDTANIDIILANYEAMNNGLNKLTNSLIPIMEITNKHGKIISDITATYQSINPLEIFIKNMPPIYMIERYTLTQNTLQQIHNSFNLIDWNSLNVTLNNILQTISELSLDFIITDKEMHADLLYHYVCEIDDENLKSIFTYDFILKIIMEDWWIIPTFDIDYYKKISSERVNDLNQSFLNEYYDNPNLIKEMVEKWNIPSDIRKTIINQALFNYMCGNYETCVILLILQIEGIMKEAIDPYGDSTSLRISLEKKLNNNPTTNPWYLFLNKANIDYIWTILKPLFEHSDFKKSFGEVNRNGIAHNGVVKANQLIAMRLFFIIDTLIYILNQRIP